MNEKKNLKDRQVCAELVHRLTTWHCPHPAAYRTPCCCGARWPPPSTDISCSPGPQQQTRRWQPDRQTVSDGRTDTVPLHRPCSILCGQFQKTQSEEVPDQVLPCSENPERRDVLMSRLTGLFPRRNSPGIFLHTPRLAPNLLR